MLDTTAISNLSQRIPSEFITGVATSSWQIEGDSSGRGRSIWDDFADVPGNIKDGSKADPACDHVNRLDEDLDLIANLGVKAYRFSFSWPRLMPGSRNLNQKGIDFYNRLIDGLLERNVMPVATLYHWDLPSELEAEGGWLSPEIHNRFAEYAGMAATHFGDRVSMWATFNEPWVSAFLGYATKIHAPGRGDPAAGLEAAYRLMVSHGYAMDVLREHKVSMPGIVLNLTSVISKDPNIDHVADHIDSLQNRFWLDLRAGRGIDESLIERTQGITDWAFVEDSDLDKINQKIDWLGINYYTPFRLVPHEGGSESKAVGQDFSLFPGSPSGARMNPLEPRTEMGWEIHAPSMTTTLLQTSERLPETPLYITENGGAFPDQMVNGRVEDQARIDYYISHISAALDAMDQGVDLRGYFAWSLMDNIEWAEGLEKRFGLVHVDHETQLRTPKASYEAFSLLVRSS